MFGSLKTMNVAEIGAGYGGQAAAIHCIDGFASYTVFDLPEASSLAQRYSKAVGFEIVVGDLESEPRKAYDLVISNYALSEIPKSIQVAYLDKIVRRTPRGYMLWNQQRFSSIFDEGIFTAEDIAAMVPSGHIAPPQFMPPADARLGIELIYWRPPLPRRLGAM